MNASKLTHGSSLPISILVYFFPNVCKRACVTPRRVSFLMFAFHLTLQNEHLVIYQHVMKIFFCIYPVKFMHRNLFNTCSWEIASTFGFRI